jgi:putative flippase GtrA
MKQAWIARAKRFATYALVGCFDTGMDWVAFTTAHELLHFTPLICQAIGYIVGTVCSYFLNGRITFRDGHIARWRQCLRFAVERGVPRRERADDRPADALRPQPVYRQGRRHARGRAV